MALAEVPKLFALYRPEQVEKQPEEGIAAWVLAVPGTVYVLSAGSGHGTLIKSESLERVEQFWAPMMDADMVAVTDSAADSTGTAVARQSQ